MRVRIFVALAILVAMAGCLQKPQNATQASAKEHAELVLQEYLNGTWSSVPKANYKGKPIPKEQYSWGEGEFNPGFYAFDLKRGRCFTFDGFRFLAGIKALEQNVYEIGLNKPLDHKPTDEEIAAHKAAGPDEIIVVHFINKDKIWIDLQKGFDMDKDFNPQRNIYYRYSGPGTAVQP